MGKSKKTPSNKRRAARAKRAKADTNGNNNENKTMERMTARASAFGSSLVHLGVIWFICAGLALVVQHSRAHNNSIDVDGYSIPLRTQSAWMEYPNPLNITDKDREAFHPVVKFPQVWMDVPNDQVSPEKKKKKRQKVDNYQVMDHTKSSAAVHLATEEERQRKGKNRRVPPPTEYSIGRYDENRVNLYASDMFDDEAHDIDGFAGARTVHIGIDLAGPIGTKVYAFADGIVHSAGYNADLGDYGNVIVLEHDLGAGENGEARKVWALYGHLDDKSIVGKSTGKSIKKGQMIGRFGDIHENGGWFSPHVHFQLSLEPPDTHDMPGVVSMEDRPRALIQYPDPRQVLGPLH